MVFGIADNDDAPSAGFDLSALGNTLRGIVGSLGVKVRADFQDEGAHIGLGKNDDGIDGGESGQNLGPFISWNHRAALAFERTDGIIRIDRHNNLAAEFAGGVEIAHMADVQQIEAAVGQRDASTGAAPFGHALLELASGKDLGLDGCAQ